MDHLDDVASDLSVFHRIDDIGVLDGPTFFRLAWRLPAYNGVMRAIVTAEHQEATARGADEAYAPGRPRDINPGTQASLAAEPAFAGIFSFG